MGIQAIDLRRKVFAEILNKKRLTLFTWCVPAYCVVIFPIRCDFSDFFHSRPSTLKESYTTCNSLSELGLPVLRDFLTCCRQTSR